jgi:GTP cyclohydrolase I
MKFNRSKCEKAVKMLLESFGEDTEREGLKETPRRVAGYWEELLEGNEYTNEEIAKMFSKKFLVKNDTLVVKEVENIYSHCEHHLALMFNMKAVIAYIPKKVKGGYEVIGLSKIPRIVDMCSKRLQLQEKLASDIAECISLATGSKDIYVNISGDHGCVSARGAKSSGFTDVTYLSGLFRKNSDLRNEVERKISSR